MQIKIRMRNIDSESKRLTMKEAKEYLRMAMQYKKMFHVEPEKAKTRLESLVFQISQNPHLED